MNSKVIKWFKRQASIRRHSTDKSDDKLPSSNCSSEEKRKYNFPRLSFRKRNRRKVEKETEFDSALAVIGISKKFSLSVPKEMEANTKDPVTNVPNSVSVNLGSISLTNSPNKTDGYSGASDLSYHSSFDYSKENINESISLSEAAAAKPLLTEKEESEISKYSNCDNPQSFHSMNSSIHTISNAIYSDSVHNTTARHENAPIVKMDDICDIICDKELPEETQSSSTSESLKVIINNANIKTSDSGNPSFTNDKIYEDLCDKNLEGHLIKKCEEMELFIKEEIDMSDNQVESHNNKNNETVVDVFEEIDRLVRDATSITEDNIVEMGDSHKDEAKEVEASLNHNEIDTKDEIINDSDVIEENDSTSENITVLSTDESFNSYPTLSKADPINIEENEKEPQKDEVEIDSGNLNIDNAISSDSPNTLQNLPLQTENKITDFDVTILESSKAENDVELVITEESDLSNYNNSDTITKCDPSESTDLNNSELLETDSSTTVQIVLTQSSPVKHSKINKTRVEISSKQSGYYPKELNPFGDDDSDSTEGINDSAHSFVLNKEVSPNRRNLSNIKENVNSQFERETSHNLNGRSRNVRERSSSPNRRIVVQHEIQSDYGKKENGAKSLNPFGDSDDEGVSSLNSTNLFDDEDEDATICGSSSINRTIRETPPRLPPKSSDLQSRKNSRGSLAPVPIPRRSKQSHHGSYTSLQNVSTAPIPAPRSITPYGSTKTLNFSTNPFDDDHNEASLGDFDRRTIGRSSMQTLPVSASVDHLSRTSVRGSLPPLSRGKKKRPAPLPPGFSQRKQQLYPNLAEFSSLPRKRSSTSPASEGGNFDKKSSTSRGISPHRIPPPRPPPPKIN